MENSRRKLVLREINWHPLFNMTPRLRLRVMTPADFTFADHVRSLAGWNQTRRDWQRFLDLAPDGCFVAEWDGQPAGTATTTCHGRELAWIGMVLVHPDHRRHGIGTALLKHCITHLRQADIGCIKLDATPAGQPLYEKLGFQAEWNLARWERKPAPVAGQSASNHLRPWAAADLSVCEKLDQHAFGVSRGPLIQALAEQSRAIVHTAPNGEVTGYGMIRPGSRARYLGPVVAANDAAGTELVESLLAAAATETVYWDIPESNAPAVALAQRLGFVQQRTLVRMFLGENKHPGHPEMQFAITAPETG